MIHSKDTLHGYIQNRKTFNRNTFKKGDIKKKTLKGDKNDKTRKNS